MLVKAAVNSIDREREAGKRRLDTVGMRSRTRHWFVIVEEQ
jgi:hypothetical protein